MGKGCIVHVSHHFYPGRGWYAWCESHGKLSHTTGKPAKTDSAVFVGNAQAAGNGATLHLQSK